MWMSETYQRLGDEAFVLSLDFSRQGHDTFSFAEDSIRQEKYGCEIPAGVDRLLRSKESVPNPDAVVFYAEELRSNALEMPTGTRTQA